MGAVLKMKEIDIAFDFDLSSTDIAAINALDTRIRRGPAPDAITLENCGRDIPEA
jgi:hypothetical protein